MFTLHVTNGDSAAQGLARSGLPGDVVAWRDVLHDGPVPEGDPSDDFRRTRAQFLEARQWALSDDAEDDFAARDARLADLSASDALMLWFEPDLYDQLQLVQILHRLAQQDATQRPDIFIAPADHMLGPLSPEKFRPVYAQRRGVTEIDLACGAAAWRAFTSAKPESLLSTLVELDRSIPVHSYAADASVRLPHLPSAVRRMLEEYPDAQNGLSRSEQQICEVLAPGPLTIAALYPDAHHASESWPWLGDTSFAWYLERLSDVARPLVTHANGSRVLAPKSRDDERTFWGRTVALTPFGADVLGGRENAVDVNGIDRWIGGVHLTTERHWLWDGHGQRVVERAARRSATH